MGASLADELRAAWAVAKKELLITRRYPLQLVNEVMQPLYQFLLPSLLLGLTFYVGGRAIGLETSVGTDDLPGYLFLGIPRPVTSRPRMSRVGLARSASSADLPQKVSFFQPTAQPARACTGEISSERSWPCSG
jgi:hypothetical protein